MSDVKYRSWIGLHVNIINVNACSGFICIRVRLKMSMVMLLSYLLERRKGHKSGWMKQNVLTNYTWIRIEKYTTIQNNSAFDLMRFFSSCLELVTYRSLVTNTFLLPDLLCCGPRKISFEGTGDLNS